MDLKHFTNQGDGVYEILLKGIVGDDLDGDRVAEEIKFLNDFGAKVIIERINSVGGGIVNGLSIISANINSKAEIHTYNDGMAGSIASVILASGTPGKRFGMDFSTAVIHNPLYGGVSLDDIQDPKEKSDLNKLKESLVTIYANNTKLTKAQARKMMSADTLLDVKEQKEIGLIDEIVTSKRKPALTENMTYMEIMNVCDGLNEVVKEDFKQSKIINTKSKKMSDLTKFYNLVEEADEATILKEAQKDRSNLALAKNEVDTLKETGVKKDEEITGLKEKVQEFEAKAEEAENKVIEAKIDSLIESGKFLKDQRESLFENAKTIGLTAFNKFVEGMAIAPVNVLVQINNDEKPTGEVKKTKNEKLAEEYQNLAESDRVELRRIKTEEPEKFEKMFNAWNQ
jgi:ATP-dependent Clp protease protease subunit